MKIIIGITGASGSIYARKLTESLSACKGVEVSLIITYSGRSVAEYEGEYERLTAAGVKIYDNSDMFAAPASGSARFDAMVIIPCSMGTLGRIASGISSDLLTRAADVMLKERRRLIIVPRETPLNTIHLRNMTTLSECGAIICPASPSFYSRPDSVEELCSTVTERVLSLLGVPHSGFEWGDQGC